MEIVVGWVGDVLFDTDLELFNRLGGGARTCSPPGGITEISPFEVGTAYYLA